MRTTPQAPPESTWGQPHYQPPNPPRKRRISKLGWLGIGVAVFLVGGVISNATGGNDTDTTSAPVATTTAAPAAVAPAATETPDLAPASTAAPVTTAKPKPATWHTVVSVSGNTDKRTPLFTLRSDRTRLRYTIRDTSGFGAAIVAIYVLDEGTSLASDGGFPEVMASEPGTDSTELAQGPGRYYLDVSAANARWTVTIQEYR